jgi:uncharacterized protein YydD (DUF2326 family)
MRLLKLSANKDTFRAVTFNRQGLSLVVAEQRTPKSSRTKTYNGVGKSLMLELLHFCLGSNANKAFETHLKDWIFYLDVEIEGAEHTIGRSADKPKDITFDGERLTLTKLRDKLEGACFELDPSISHLSFRSLIERFIRSGRDSYTSFFYANGSERKDPYGAMLRNAFLLGLDLHLAKKKYELRKREQKLVDTMKQLEEEPLFAELLAQDTVDIELTALKERASRLTDDLQSFRVADDYHAIEQEANQIKRELDRVRRESVKLADAIAQIDRSLKTKGDLPKERVFQLYSEAQRALPDQLRRRIEEVVKFQQDLQRRRMYRLTRDRQELERQHRGVDEEIRTTSARLDDKLRYLGDHRALDEYVAVSSALSEVRQQIAKLEEAKALRDRVSRELRRITRDLADQNILTDDYLTNVASLVEEATTRFRSYARELYGERKSGLSVSNDEGENQQRYRIDAHITADAAEGINEAKIFCYDMTILTLRHGHQVGFLAHDSSLFGPVDPRQRLTMFSIAERAGRDLGLQYIATMNLHDVTSIREQLDVEKTELERLVGGTSVVLTLADDAPQNKLLGIDVDMNYLDTGAR